MSEETYHKPPHGWTCFHCGETFTTFGGARDHFGFTPDADPACRIKIGAERGLVMALRQSEKAAADAWDALHSETSDIAKAYHAAIARHGEHLVTAEEAGFECGIRQARSELKADHEAALLAAEERGEARGMDRAAKIADGCELPMRDWAPGSFYATVRREVGDCIRAVVKKKELQE